MKEANVGAEPNKPPEHELTVGTSGLYPRGMDMTD